MAQRAPTLSQSVEIVKGALVQLHHRVGDAGIAQLDVGAGDLLAVYARDTRRLRHAGVVQADLILLLADAPGGDQPRRRQHTDALRVARKAVLHAVAGDAARAVAAHLAERAVGVIK